MPDFIQTMLHAFTTDLTKTGTTTISLRGAGVRLERGRALQTTTTTSAIAEPLRTRGRRQTGTGVTRRPGPRRTGMVTTDRLLPVKAIPTIAK